MAVDRSALPRILTWYLRIVLAPTRLLPGPMRGAAGTVLIIAPFILVPYGIPLLFADVWTRRSVESWLDCHLQRVAQPADRRYVQGELETKLSDDRFCDPPKKVITTFELESESTLRIRVRWEKDLRPFRKRRDPGYGRFGGEVTREIAVR